MNGAHVIVGNTASLYKLARKKVSKTYSPYAPHAALELECFPKGRSYTCIPTLKIQGNNTKANY